MDTEKYTKKATNAINSAQVLAVERHNQELTPEHLTYALLADDNGLIPKLLTKCGVDSVQLQREVDMIISKITAVTGSGAQQIYMANDTTLILSAADKLRQK